MAAKELRHACRCGQTELALDVTGFGAASRIICYCDDCQTFARALDAQADVLGPGSGTGIVQSTPDRLRIVKGAENLAILRLSPKGLLRWYAGCCDTPMCNSLPKMGVPFVGIVFRREEGPAVTQILGKRCAQVFTTTARPRGEAPRKDVGFAVTGFAVLRRMIVALLSGRAKTNPLRAPAGAPIAPIRVLTPEERHDARP